MAVGEPAKISDYAVYKGCGACNRRCPVGVNIKRIVQERENGKKENSDKSGIENYIHCKSCSFFCKAGKNIALYIQQ